MSVEQLEQATNRLIELANQLHHEGIDRQVVSSALMGASAIYATYTAAGNDGFLRDSGIDRVTEVYRKHLAFIQTKKQEQLQAEGYDTEGESGARKDEGAAE